MSVQLRDLNNRYTEINTQADEENDLVDYRYYVDDLLHIYPNSAHQDDPNVQEMAELVSPKLSLHDSPDLFHTVSFVNPENDFM